MNINLTAEELDRLKTVVAYNVDMNIQPQLDKAMEQKMESDIEYLLRAKRMDTGILHKLWEATDE